MIIRSRVLVLAASVFAAGLIGCSSGPVPQSATPPAVPDFSGPAPLVVGAADSLGSVAGSEAALYTYRFKQMDPPSERFTFQDRDLNFYFKPSPDAVHIQIENRQGRPVVIDWERSTITDPWGRTERVAHGSTRWSDRFGTQAPTTIVGLQRFGDYVFPMSYLVDPAGTDQQLHRPLFPEGSGAPQYADRDVAFSLWMLIEGQPRTYTFRFRAASIIPR